MGTRLSEAGGCGDAGKMRTNGSVITDAELDLRDHLAPLRSVVPPCPPASPRARPGSDAHKSHEHSVITSKLRQLPANSDAESASQPLMTPAPPEKALISILFSEQAFDVVIMGPGAPASEPLGPCLCKFLGSLLHGVYFQLNS